MTYLRFIGGIQKHDYTRDPALGGRIFLAKLLTTRKQAARTCSTEVAIEMPEGGVCPSMQLNKIERHLCGSRERLDISVLGGMRPGSNFCKMWE